MLLTRVSVGTGFLGLATGTRGVAPGVHSSTVRPPRVLAEAVSSLQCAVPSLRMPATLSGLPTFHQNVVSRQPRNLHCRYAHGILLSYIAFVHSRVTFVFQAIVATLTPQSMGTKGSVAESLRSRWLAAETEPGASLDFAEAERPGNEIMGWAAAALALVQEATAHATGHQSRKCLDARSSREHHGGVPTVSTALLADVYSATPVRIARGARAIAKAIGKEWHDSLKAKLEEASGCVSGSVALIADDAAIMLSQLVAVDPPLCVLTDGVHGVLPGSDSSRMLGVLLVRDWVFRAVLKGAPHPAAASAQPVLGVLVATAWAVHETFVRKWAGGSSRVAPLPSLTLPEVDSYNIRDIGYGGGAKCDGPIVRKVYADSDFWAEHCRGKHEAALLAEAASSRRVHDCVAAKEFHGVLVRLLLDQSEACTASLTSVLGPKESGSRVVRAVRILPAAARVTSPSEVAAVLVLQPLRSRERPVRHSDTACGSRVVGDLNSSQLAELKSPLCTVAPGPRPPALGAAALARPGDSDFGDHMVLAEALGKHRLANSEAGSGVVKRMREAVSYLQSASAAGASATSGRWPWSSSVLAVALSKAEAAMLGGHMDRVASDAIASARGSLDDIERNIRAAQRRSLDAAEQARGAIHPSSGGAAGTAATAVVSLLQAVGAAPTISPLRAVAFTLSSTAESDAIESDGCIVNPADATTVLESALLWCLWRTNAAHASTALKHVHTIRGMLFLAEAALDAARHAPVGPARERACRDVASIRLELVPPLDDLEASLVAKRAWMAEPREGSAPRIARVVRVGGYG